MIDVGFIAEGTEQIGFVSVSGHSPAAFADTFDPEDLGPFKALAPA
jgi:hypothetical protein